MVAMIADSTGPAWSAAASASQTTRQTGSSRFIRGSTRPASRKQPAALFRISNPLDAEGERGEPAAELEFPLLVFDRVLRLVEDGEELLHHLVAVPIKAREILQPLEIRDHDA